MSSIACVFPGQGSQHPEMLKTDLVDQSFINENIEIVCKCSIGVYIYMLKHINESQLS